MNVTANFAIDTFTLDYAAGTGGSLTGDTSQTVNYGEDGTAVTAVPDTGYHFVDWSDGSTDNPRTDTNVRANVNVTANFEEIPSGQYVLAVYTEGGGNVTLNPAGGTYDEGTDVSLTAVPVAGWTFDQWSGDLTGSANPATITMDGDKMITATFTQDKYSLTVTVVGNGAASRDPNQTSYHYGDQVELTATADPGWTFDHWSGDLTGSDNPASITMDEDKTVTAHFTQDDYTLTVNVVGSGSVTPDPTGPYHHGDVIELTAEADPDWEFSGWSGDLSGDTNPESITMDGNKTVTATFIEEGSGTPVFQVFLPYIATDRTPTLTEGDGNPPASRVSRLGSVQYSPAFTVKWTESTPGGPEIECYDVQFKDGSDSWEDWRTCTTATSAQFYGQPGHVYYFRSRATDDAGNVEAWPSEPDTRTVVRSWTWW